MDRAAAQLDDIREICHAFQRGDQPEKTEHLTLTEIIEVHDKAKSVLDFCLLAMQSNRGLRARDASTYSTSRQFVRSMAYVLLHRPELDKGSDVAQRLNHWLVEVSPALPNIMYQYVGIAG